MSASRLARRTAHLLRIGLIAAVAATPAAAQVVINEVVPANLDGLADAEGDHPDWIELYNPSAAAVDLTGWGLSDDPADPAKWVFPSARIAPQGALVLFASRKGWRASSWRTVLDRGDPWRYRIGDSEPPAQWMTAGFDDSAWPEGPSGFGYGDGDDATVVPAVLSLYVRATFEVERVDEVGLILLHVDYDDGFVAYLNGVEVARANVGVDNVPPAHDREARSEHEASLPGGGTPELWVVEPPPGLLNEGANTVALQVHNNSIESSDLSLTPFLTIGRSGPDAFTEVPEILLPTLPRLHTSFSLDASGETIVLSDASGTVVDEVEVPHLLYGDALVREPDGSSTLLLTDEPTPGASNHGGRSGYAQAPQVITAGGPQVGPTAVEVAHASGAALLRYTLDGSEPTGSSPRYAGPVAIDATTVLRVRAFETGRLPSPIVTRTFLFGEEELAMPVVSLATDPANLWDEETGIYVFGDDHDPEYPYYGANFWQDWERPVHVEMFELGGAPLLVQDAGLKIHGGKNRAFPQRSLRLHARGGYGDGDFDGRLFTDLDLDAFRTLVLRNAGNDWCYSQLRDGIVATAVQDLDVDVMAFRPATTFINGEYWGILNLRERIDEDYLASHHDVDPDRIDLLEFGGDIIEGSNRGYWELLDLVTTADPTDPTTFEAIRARMETEQYATYNIVEIFFANTDWPGGNVKFWRPQEPDGRWRWVLFDMDFALDWYVGPAHDTLAFATAPDSASWQNPPWSTVLLRSLLEVPTFRRDFVNRYADLLNSTFLPQRLHAVVARLRALIEPQIPRHTARWDCSVETWRSQMDSVSYFIRERPAHARRHVLEYFGLAGTYTLSLDVEPVGAGSIELTALTVEGPFSGTYFIGNPLTLRARPASGWIFAGWSGGSPASSSHLTIDPSGDVQLLAHFAPASSPVTVNEINYNSPPDFDPEDWVELHNAGAAPVDLSGWTMTDDDPTHVLVLPQGTVLAAGGYLVLARDPAAFSAAFPAVTNVLPAGFGFALDNGGDEVRLYDAAGVEQDGVAYDDDPPWPSAADGDGSTLALVSPRLDNGEAGAWFASGGNGTPGALNRPAAEPAPRPGPRVERGPTAVTPR